MAVGSLAASTPYLAVILGAIIVAWIGAARSLAGQFEDAMAETEVPSESVTPQEPPSEGQQKGAEFHDEGLFNKATTVLKEPGLEVDGPKETSSE